jgi:hypothetical protein
MFNLRSFVVINNGVLTVIQFTYTEIFEQCGLPGNLKYSVVGQ